ncbi:MAG: hypothetical protein L6Q76_23070 [Polyangiaceae bacterium]|nr:hypothetical protein [Polyangiaceae bacterium]
MLTALAASAVLACKPGCFLETRGDPRIGKCATLNGAVAGLAHHSLELLIRRLGVGRHRVSWFHRPVAFILSRAPLTRSRRI